MESSFSLLRANKQWVFVVAIYGSEQVSSCLLSYRRRHPGAVQFIPLFFSCHFFRTDLLLFLVNFTELRSSATNTVFSLPLTQQQWCWLLVYQLNLNGCIGSACVAYSPTLMGATVSKNVLRRALLTLRYLSLLSSSDSSSFNVLVLWEQSSYLLR